LCEPLQTVVLFFFVVKGEIFFSKGESWIW